MKPGFAYSLDHWKGRLDDTLEWKTGIYVTLVSGSDIIPQFWGEMVLIFDNIQRCDVQSFLRTPRRAHASQRHPSACVQLEVALAPECDIVLIAPDGSAASRRLPRSSW